MMPERPPAPAPAVRFQIETRLLSGRQVHAHVRIKLQDRTGKIVEQRATYIIDTTPRIVIVRDTFAL
jgi:acyl-ACP thioesterase